MFEDVALEMEHLDIESICRICLKSDEEMLLIFDEKNSKNGIPIKQMIKDCTSCNVIRYDSYPHHICKNCLDNLFTAYRFQKQCQEAYLLVKVFLGDKDNELSENNKENCSNEKSTQTESQIFFPCEKCDERFWTSKELIDHHFYKHRNTLNVCKVCKQVFSRLGFLREHLSSKHPETGVQSRSECKICKKRFCQTSHLTRHLHNVHKIHDIDALNRIKRNEKISIEEKTEVENRVDYKLRNDEIENSVDEVGKDILDMKEIEIKSSERTVEMNSEVLVKEELIIMDMEFKDEKTNDISDSDEDLYPLSKLKKKVLLTDEKMSNQQSSSKKRKENEETELDCQKDSMMLKEALEKKDSKLKKRPRPKSVAKYKCKQCDRKFPYPGRLHKHEITHVNDKILKCPNCSKSFAAEYLKIHQQRVHAHNEEKSYICSKCNQSFSNRYRLRVHAKTCSIERQKKFTCSYDNCLEAFDFIDNYRMHVKKTHTLHQKIWICSFCAKSFNSKAEIQKHSTEHDSEKPHLCNECGKRFGQINRLNIHIMRHSGEKKLKCKYCEKRFIRASDLTVHQMYHTGEKPHKCQTCGRGFIRACSLKVHVRTHTGEKPYQCSYCERSFAQRQDMTAHVRRLHTGERYDCSLCGEGYVHLYQLTHHKKSVHGINEPSHIQRVKKIDSKNDKELR